MSAAIPGGSVCKTPGIDAAHPGAWRDHDILPNVTTVKSSCGLRPVASDRLDQPVPIGLGDLGLAFKAS